MGALTLPTSMEAVLDAPVLVVPLDIVDIEEIVDIVEDTDSFEAFLFN